MKKSEIQFLLNRIKINYTEKGFKRLLLYLFNFIIEQFIVITYIYKLELDKISYNPPDKGLTFEIIKVQDLDLIHLKHKEEDDENSYQQFLEKFKDPENNGFITKKDNEICGYFFIKYKNTYPVLKEDYVDINDNGYLSYEYVFKKYRGQKIQQFNINTRLQMLKEKNFKTATAIILKTNYPSIRSFEKFGFKKCVIFYFFRFGKWIRSKDHFKII
jgi:ribosomal protein S18 acetylase RimI-like enzyme